MRSKKVIDRDDYVQKIRAAVDARGDRDFFIVARTDALAAADLDEGTPARASRPRGRRRCQLCRGTDLA